MKFDLASIPKCDLSPTPRVGDVYPAQGGKPTVAWVVVNVREERVIMLGVDDTGEVCSSATYGAHALEDRPRIGFCNGIQDMHLVIRRLKDSRRGR